MLLLANRTETNNKQWQIFKFTINYSLPRHSQQSTDKRYKELSQSDGTFRSKKLHGPMIQAPKKCQIV